MKTSTFRCWSLIVISVMIISWLSVDSAYSQSSANYQIERAVLDAGGGERNSENYGLCDSLGQPSSGVISTSASFIHIPGFYECYVEGNDPGPGPGPGPDPEPTPPAAIPEPGTFVLFATGILGLGLLLKRKFRKRS